MPKANKAKAPEVKQEVATPEVAPPAPPQKPKASDKPKPDARPTRVYVTESGLTIEEF